MYYSAFWYFALLQKRNWTGGLRERTHVYVSLRLVFVQEDARSAGGHGHVCADFVFGVFVAAVFAFVFVVLGMGEFIALAFDARKVKGLDG